MLRAIAALPFVGVALVLAVTAQAEGDRVRVAPAVGIAGHYGTWTVTWTAGAGGLRTGGALRATRSSTRCTNAAPTPPPAPASCSTSG